MMYVNRFGLFDKYRGKEYESIVLKPFQRMWMHLVEKDVFAYAFRPHLEKRHVYLNSTFQQQDSAKHLTLNIKRSKDTL